MSVDITLRCVTFSVAVGVAAIAVMSDEYDGAGQLFRRVERILRAGGARDEGRRGER
jgi:hypothetical protein